MALTHSEYHRTTVNLTPTEELFVKQEAERRHTTQRQVVRNAISTYQRVTSGDDLVNLYGDKLSALVRDSTEELGKQLEKTIRNTLFQTFSKALEDRFERMEHFSIATALMTATMMAELQTSKGDGIKEASDIMQDYFTRARTFRAKMNAKKSVERL